jgi:hypothetical protein
MSKAVIQGSVRIYDLLLKFYPKSYRAEFGEEMKYVFSETLKETYDEKGETGIVGLWARTVVDTCKSLFRQHLEDQKGGVFMKNDIIMQNKVFLWIAAATAAILTLPLLAMQFNWVKPDPSNPNDRGVDWSLGDFVVMGILIFGAASLFVAIARITPAKYRLLIAIAVLVAFLLIWAHLAVGIVDSWPFAGS